ncbi:MAG: type I methionyl aminopeptidase [Clostridiales bacterium]|jgi:methionyl aminopeptidase|nr:type I methionyl aminopeptidase [Clostridiales bacterium]
MAINIKNDEQIALMRVAGELTAQCHRAVASVIRPGVTTMELEKEARAFMEVNDADPSFLGYNGYPAALCVSVNEEIIHGTPSLKKLKNGDIVSVDIGVKKNGFHGDCARTYFVGDVSPKARNLVETTEASFFEGVKFAEPGRRLYEISGAINDYVESAGYSVVREYVGHGVGRRLHEDPQIPNYRMPSKGPRLAAGMVLAIEPMVNAGRCEIKLLDDGWTVVTADGSLSAHYENTILITETGYEILTPVE